MLGRLMSWCVPDQALRMQRPANTANPTIADKPGTTSVETVLTPVGSPRANAFAQRWVRTVRQDCLDHLLVLSRRHLEAVLAEYLQHYNRARRHRGLDLSPPQPTTTPEATGTIRRHDILDGLIHQYERAA